MKWGVISAILVQAGINALHLDSKPIQFASQDDLKREFDTWRSELEEHHWIVLQTLFTIIPEPRAMT